MNKLKRHGITCICDVRSTPYSKYASDYNIDLLRVFLKENGITYVYLGDEFGARREDRSLYDEDGKLNFEKTIESDLFKFGVSRLENGLDKGYKIALMCTEKKPEDCHRSIMVGHALSELGFDVKNILEDGSLNSQEDIDELLLDRYGYYQIEMSFDTHEEPKSFDKESAVRRAYHRRSKEIAYKLEDKENENDLHDGVYPEKR